MKYTDVEAIRIAVVLGTSRPNSYTSMALIPILDELKNSHAKYDLIDPAKLNLLFPGFDTDTSDAQDIKGICANANGIIFSTPEYHGSMSAIAKLIIENLGFPSVLARKPIVIMGVAAGSSGAIKSLEQLRRVLSHIGAIVLPGPVSIARVNKVFNEDGICQNKTIERRLRDLVGTLLDYIDR